ncbi:TRAP transporter small permease [Chelativorans sp. M5D2P16]|uniref:TRAP transporter small permease n=1 Tax=Chelativorans sp. M5D2P16 TaxID=3095678 RepID=UPI002ACA01C9|nr:TRAP transporter small permease [Chelativorans sp. M5D2P16]MDZ5697877.1 TRAP transporter small permease [Chelativorans sp. M5D2P16]
MLRRGAANLDLGVACLALVVVVASVAWGVLTRYVVSQPAVWTTELSSIAFAWVVFFGAAAAMRRGMHIAIPIFVDMLPATARKAATLLSLALVIGFLGYTFYLAGLLSAQSFNRPSPVLRISFAYVYAGIAAALFLMLVHAILQLFAVWRSTDGTIAYPPQEAEEAG